MRNNADNLASRAIRSVQRSIAAGLRWMTASASEQTLIAWLRTNLSATNDVGKPMALNTAVYSAVKAIATTAGGLPIVAYSGERDNIIKGGPAFELLKQPMPGMTAGQFVEQWAGHFVESGEAHILMDRGPASGRIRGMNAVGRRQFEPVREPLTGGLLYWQYAPMGGSQRINVLPDEDAYSRLLNPYDPIRGLSPLEAAALGIRQDYLAASYNVAALENGGAPGGLYVHPGEPSKDQRDEYIAAIRARHEGAGNANRPGFLWGGMDYKATAFKNTDLDLLPGRKFNRDEVFNAFGVPAVIVAIYEAAHYDVADASIEVFLTFTMSPIIKAFEDVMNLRVLPQVQPGVQIYLDLSKHPVLQRLSLAKIDSLGKAVKSGVPYNEAVVFCGLPFAKQKWGDESLLESGLTTAEDVIAGMQAPPEVPPIPPADPPRDPKSEPAEDAAADRETAAASDAALRLQEKLTQAAAKIIGPRYRAFFFRQERELLKRLRRAMAAAGAAAQTAAELSSDEIKAIVRKVLLDVGGETVKLKALVRDYFPAVAEKAIRAELARLGVDADKIDGLVADIRRGSFFQSQMRVKQNKISGMAAVQHERLRSKLTEGLSKGETIQELADRVHAELGGNRSRAVMIARTEAGQAVSTGRFLAARKAGAQGKAWLTGSNPRATHIAAGARYAPGAKAIAISEPFRVGGALLMYPRDPAGPAGEIINCNCVMVTQRIQRETQSEGAAA